jgi:hypothetical protein
MKITAIIPCANHHFNKVNKVLDKYLLNTLIPNQVIISLNGTKYLHNFDIETFEKRYSEKFESFIIVKSTELLSRGKARNVCIPHIISDIVCFSDADDEEHFQRFEIIKHFFENHDIKHLLHSYILSNCNSNHCNNCFQCSNTNYVTKFKEYDIPSIDYCSPEDVLKLNYYNTDIKPNVKTVVAISQYQQILPVHGLVCVKADVFKDIKFNENYPRGQDCLFSQEVVHKYGKSIVINAQLHLYYNGWIPAYNDFDHFDIKRQNKMQKISLNLGARIPPKPATPMTEYDKQCIQKAILEIYN